MSDGTPVWLDIPVWATRLPDPNRDGRTRVRLSAEGEDALGTAFVYRNRWYPGQGSTARTYDLYFSALARTFDGLERADQPERVRLQLFQAVRTTGCRPMVGRSASMTSASRGFWTGRRGE